jgi:hypothetical protein
VPLPLPPNPEETSARTACNTPTLRFFDRFLN